ncbi:MAG: hypothetical protein NZ901_07180 [Geminocystis sp.]|nr:hypothetical protein [Geminocystis sp.]HIK36587.1 hypothetical protein [Geminocystis sp. M7585_C2015_104]MCS7147957.1 hypothetical protein [Geminocystis sp.]MCX8078784.1 hypothetical protein [Geminocystis sp.]MDW8116847.1 hypothetical protein [Geminocystis sp.]
MNKIYLQEDETPIDINNTEGTFYYPKEFTKIIWAENDYLNEKQPQILGAKISQEVIETLLLFPPLDSTNFSTFPHNLPPVCCHDLNSTIEKAKKNFNA